MILWSYIGYDFTSPMTGQKLSFGQCDIIVVTI